MAFVDAWFWSNRGWAAFGVEKPPEYSSPDGLVQYVKAKGAQSVLVALTHDHVDHMGDYFETLTALHQAGINVKTVAQADMARFGMVQKYRDAGLEPTETVLNAGGGANIGGYIEWDGFKIRVVPAAHSTFSGFPAIGYVLEVGGIRFYASGDTDVYGDMRLVGQRFKPDVALVCVSGGAYTMDPEGAALAVEFLGAPIAIPYHYGHNPLSLGPEAAEQFRERVKAATPNVEVRVMTPGETIELSLP
jgi:L-ascorbate metabolism protein UlaG (beta-lactamase superfamily)